MDELLSEHEIDITVAASSRLFRHIGKADMIIPYQILSEVMGKSFLRRGLSNAFTFMVNLISGYNIKYYNGLPVYTRYSMMRWHPSSYGFGFQAEKD